MLLHKKMFCWLLIMAALVYAVARLIWDHVTRR